MRIAEINDIASVASDLSAGLRGRGHEVRLIQPRLVGGSLPWAIKPVVGPVRAVEWAQIIRELKRERYDAVHIHYAYLGMLGVLGKLPYLLHCHGSDIRRITPFTLPMVERALRDASAVFYATPDLGAFVLKRRPDATFLPNPVDSETFAPRAPVTGSKDVYICCSLTDIKGTPRILQACRRLAAERPDIRLTAIGGGPFSAKFAELPNIRLIGRQQRRYLPEVISQHGVVIGQALLGVVGMAEFESMACGRPLVAWFRYNHAYPESPPIVRALDGYDIAENVMRLVDDVGERARVGEASRRWVQRHHGVDAVAARVERAAYDMMQASGYAFPEGLPQTFD